MTAESTISPVDEGVVAALTAPGPDPAYAEELQTFGRFVGSWQLEVTEYDGDVVTRSGEWHFGWALGGRAVQDVWISPSRKDQLRLGVPAVEWGTAVRFYDPNIDGWRVSWSGPCKGRQLAFVARESDGRIVLEGDGVQWVFSEIEEDRFRWTALEDGRVVQEMRVWRA